LYGYIKAGAQSTILVVKGGPSINDLTRIKVKCEPIHRLIEAPFGSFVALWKEGNFSV
jgi:uncharacterized protein with ATP-grasp and redox domains